MHAAVTASAAVDRPHALEARAPVLKPRLERFGMDVTEYTRYMETQPDWNTNARVLTDQYSPGNLLNN